jgi:hypothetical protein
MMALMARARGRDNGVVRQRFRAGSAAVGVALIAALLTAGCSSPSGSDPAEPAAPAALRVSTVHGADTLDEPARADLESEVGDVLSQYIVRAFLGEYPREDFVRAFDSFTSGAARSAAADIDVLTAASVEDARSISATGLDAELSFLLDGSDVVGATAHVDFRFEVTDADGDTRPLSLTGRLMLEQEQGTWSVFGYDVARDGADVVESEVVS